MAQDRINTLDAVRERLIREGLTGKAVSLAGGDLLATLLTEEERQQLRGVDTCQFMEDLFYAQVRWLFEGPHSLACLGDTVPARLFRAMIMDGVVYVSCVGGPVSPVLLRGSVPIVADGRTLAELVESGEPFTVDIAGYQIHYEADELR